MYRQEHKNTTGTFCVSYLAAPSVLKFSKLFGILLAYSYLCTVKRNKGTIMGYSNHDKMEWALIFAMEFGRRFGLTLKQAFNYLSRFGAIKFIDEHYDYCHTQSFQSMVNDMAEYCHRKGGALV